MSVLIQDGRRIGHLKWSREAVADGLASGVVISPFHTPRVQVPRNPSGSTFASEIIDLGGQVIFDPSTDARLLPGSDDLVHYDTWQLWGSSGVGLDTDDRRLEHIERVFAREDELAAPKLAPTLVLDSPLGTRAAHALRTSQLAMGMRSNSWQSLVGRRSFWRTGADLDAYVGQLAGLRAPCWVITVANDVVLDNVPDLGDAQAFAGLFRTVHSLSRRSRVIVTHSDYAYVGAIAAGATDIGAGWDRAMRYFDPRSFQVTTAGIQIPASYVTQGQLGAVLRRDTGDAIVRLDAARARGIRGGPVPADDMAERAHHLARLTELVERIGRHGRSRRGRVGELRSFYEAADVEFAALQRDLPRRLVSDELRRRWIQEPLEALKIYATAEGLW